MRFSLGTGNRREVERLARRYAVEVDEALQAQTPPPPTHREIPCTDEPEGTILKELFDTLPVEKQAQLLQYFKPVPRLKFSQEEIQQAAQLRILLIVGTDSGDRGHPWRGNILVVVILSTGGHDGSTLGAVPGSR